MIVGGERFPTVWDSVLINVVVQPLYREIVNVMDGKKVWRGHYYLKFLASEKVLTGRICAWTVWTFTCVG